MTQTRLNVEVFLKEAPKRLGVSQAFKEDLCALLQKHYPNWKKVSYKMISEMKEKKEPNIVEIDIWTHDVERFRNEFSSLNDVKFDGMEVISQQGKDKRYSLIYRNFGSEIQFPEEGYYQLKNIFE